MSTLCHFSADQLLSTIAQLARFSDTPLHEGVTRFAYSENDELAHRYIIDLATQQGLDCRQDAVGNVFITLKGQDSSLPAIATGSHLDTVPNGGQYDGILGVVAGLYALCQFKPKTLNRDLTLIIFRCEESSRFGLSCVGSKILTGHTDPEKWHTITDSSDKTLYQVIDEAGYQSQQSTHCVLPQNAFAAFVELHIEQGRCLENANLQIGVVNGIAAPTRFQVDVYGQADHSGATPMDQRQDALVTAAHLITTINQLANQEAHLGTVGTVGKLNVYPNAMNVIPGHVRFYVDIRGIDEASIARVAQGLTQTVNDLDQAAAIRISLSQLAQEKPVRLNQTVCHIISKLCDKHTITYQPMLSGAGHDAMYMATRLPTAMIFIPSKAGISHHKEEYSSSEQILVGADLLTQTLAELANFKENVLDDSN